MLIDDVVARLSPTLGRHRNCDIIDLHPGPGIWSAKLHEQIQPRSHILVEGRTDLYMPFLQPLLDQPRSRYRHVALPGTKMSTIDQIVSDGLLPHQEVFEDGDPRLVQRNDSLLIVANLGKYPLVNRDHFLDNAQVSLLDFAVSLRQTSTLRQYGLLRLLVWLRDDERRRFVPRCIRKRNSKAIMLEFHSESVSEVAGCDEADRQDVKTKKKKTVQAKNRSHDLDLLSSVRVVNGMRERGITTPAHRKQLLQQEAEAWAAAGGEAEPDAVHSAEGPNRRQELDDLKQRFSEGRFSKWVGDQLALPADSERRTRAQLARTYTPEYARMKQLGYTGDYVRRRMRWMKWVTEQRGPIPAAADSSEPAAMDSPAEPNGTSTQLQRSRKDGRPRKPYYPASRAWLDSYADERKALQDSPPLLFWDRRTDEPLLAHADEFGPRSPLALLDIQQKPPEPGLFDDRSSASFYRHAIAHLFRVEKAPIGPSLDILGEGALDALGPQVPSLTDPAKGGNPDLSQFRVRMLRTEMIAAIFLAWQKWPFRPLREEIFGTNIPGNPNE